MKIKLKIKSLVKQNRIFDIKAILGKVVILMSKLEIEPTLMHSQRRPASIISIQHYSSIFIQH